MFSRYLDHTLVVGDGRWSARWRFTVRMRLDVWESRRLGSSPPCRTSEAAFFTISLAEPHWWFLINSLAFKNKKCHSLQNQKTFFLQQQFAINFVLTHSCKHNVITFVDTFLRMGNLGSPRWQCCARPRVNVSPRWSTVARQRILWLRMLHVQFVLLLLFRYKKK